MSKHFYLPDGQVAPGTNTDHWEWAGHYAALKKPDVIVNGGDFGDMTSLCSYDVGKKSFEGRTYSADIEATRGAMDRFITPIRQEQERLRRNKEKQWNPRMILTLGNHEERILRAIDSDRKLDGLISIDDLGYREVGWEVYDFLEPVVVDGICYSHYFPSGVMGRPVTTARALLTKKFMSCVAGHLPGRDIAYATRADGRSMIGLIAGSFYSHDQDYLSPQTNNHWRGIYVLHAVNDGQCDEMAVSIDYLKRKYG